MNRSPTNADKTSRVTTPTDREIRTERVFDAPRDRVWRAFTDPTLLAQWWGRGNKLVIDRVSRRASAPGPPHAEAATASARALPRTR